MNNKLVMKNQDMNKGVKGTSENTGTSESTGTNHMSDMNDFNKRGQYRVIHCPKPVSNYFWNWFCCLIE